MQRVLLLAVVLLTSLVLQRPALATPAASLAVVGEQFVLTREDGKRSSTADLVGATMNMADASGTTFDVRIDAANPAKERPQLTLLTMSVRDVSGAWVPFCDSDAYGRAAGFPVAGRWDEYAHFIADKTRWFITCTSGSQGKCVLFGYDPWSNGPHGEDLVPYYDACQRMVRADYDGTGTPHTKNGTLLNIYDDIGIERKDIGGGRFEAGWGHYGAVCIAKTRWPDLVTLDRLRTQASRFRGRCNEQIARKRGALLYNLSQ